MKISAPSRDDVAVDMGPMIDLVFLLLIFFMVASVVTELDKKEVNIPLSKYGKVPDDTTHRMMISIDADNVIYMGTTPVELEALKTYVESELDRDPELKILIRADKNVEYKTCKEIMIACGDVGATDLIYATFEE